MADDKPKKTLSISRTRSSASSSAAGDSGSDQKSVRSKKRVLTFAKPEPVEKAVQAKKKTKSKKSPSVLRVNALDAELGKLSKAWRSHNPLALGIEKQIFKAIADGKLSASKRVVCALLRKHCLNPNYLRNTVVGSRYGLDDQESGEVLASEAAYAATKLSEALK